MGKGVLGMHRDRVKHFAAQHGTWLPLPWGRNKAPRIPGFSENSAAEAWWEGALQQKAKSEFYFGLGGL